MRFQRWVLLPLLIAGAFAFGRSCNGVIPERHTEGRSHLPAGSAGAAPPSTRTAASEGNVVRIRDGDSIVVMRGGVGVEVRLDGVDAPELAQAFGRKAKRFTSDLAFGKTVRLAGKGKDHYDRELAEVFLPDGRSLNRELVAAGFAWWYRKYSTDRDLGAREQKAREQRRGLWADPEPMPPWDFRVAGRK